MAIQLTTYYKKNDELGAIELDVPAAGFTGWTLNGVELNAAVAEYLIRYGIKQSLADSIASAKTLAEAEGLYQKRRDAMLNNTIGVRESGGSKLPDDPIAALAVKNAKAALLARFDKAVPGAKRMADYVAHANIAPYFKLDKDDAKKAVWVESKVAAWMADQAAKAAAGDAKAVDFMADAERTLAVDASAVDLDF